MTGIEEIHRTGQRVWTAHKTAAGRVSARLSDQHPDEADRRRLVYSAIRPAQTGLGVCEPWRVRRWGLQRRQRVRRVIPKIVFFVRLDRVGGRRTRRMGILVLDVRACGQRHRRARLLSAASGCCSPWQHDRCSEPTVPAGAQLVVTVRPRRRSKRARAAACGDRLRSAPCPVCRAPLSQLG